MDLTLVIGNKNYSSWSLRAWLYMQESGLEFDEIVIPMFEEGWQEELANYTPAGRVPVLVDHVLDVSVWDSMAIIEHLRERYRDKALDWPSDPPARARARSICAEMHAGFSGLRQELPLNVRARRSVKVPERATADVERIATIWQQCREAYQDRGRWLFGKLSIADVVYAPVALRFVSYGISLADTPLAAEYIGTVGALESIQQWAAAAEQEPQAIKIFDDKPAAST